MKNIESMLSTPEKEEVVPEPEPVVEEKEDKEEVRVPDNTPMKGLEHTMPSREDLKESVQKLIGLNTMTEEPVKEDPMTPVKELDAEMAEELETKVEKPAEEGTVDAPIALDPVVESDNLLSDSPSVNPMMEEEPSFYNVNSLDRPSAEIKEPTMAPPQEPEKKKLVFPEKDQCDPKASVSSIQVLKKKYNHCNSKLQQYIIKTEIKSKMKRRGIPFEEKNLVEGFIPSEKDEEESESEEKSVPLSDKDESEQEPEVFVEAPKPEPEVEV